MESGNDVSRHDGGELDLHRLVLVPILLPEGGIGEVDVGGHHAEQLRTLDLVAVLGLERGRYCCATLDVSHRWYFAEIELTVGLKFRDLLEFGRRGGAHGLARSRRTRR